MKPATQTEVKERPILFSGSMVRAILEGRKTQTRRVLKTQPLEILDKSRGQKLVNVTRNWNGSKVWFGLIKRDPNQGVAFRCSHGEAGENLWVRESFYAFGYYRYTGNLTETGKREIEFVDTTLELGYAYLLAATDSAPATLVKDKFTHGWHKRPSIFMPRAASRITLEITNVRAERLQEISVEDITAEGVKPESGKSYPGNLGIYVEAWREGWDSINGTRKGCSWSDNPWVWAVEFTKL